MIKEETRNNNKHIYVDKSLVSLEMISANCSTNLNSIDYSLENKAFIFCTSNTIHVNSLTDCKTYLTLKGHSANSRINMCKWMKGSKIASIISVGSDGKAIIWGNKDSTKLFLPNEWFILSEIKIPEDESINAFDVLYINDKEIYITLFSSSSLLHVYYCKFNQETQLVESLLIVTKKLKYLAVSTTICVLNDNNIMILSGGYDNLVSIHSLNRVKELTSDYKCVITFHLTLQGHSNAIRDISVNNQLKPSLIGSSSQDTYVRLWALKQLTSKEVEIYQTRRKDNITIFDEYESQTSYVFSVSKEESFHILLESVLSDHEDFVSSVRFFEKFTDNKTTTFILTSSFDFTVGLWEYQEVREFK